MSEELDAQFYVKRAPGVPHCVRHKIEMRRSAQFEFLWVCPKCRGRKRRSDPKGDFA